MGQRKKCTDIWEYDEFLGWRNSRNCVIDVPSMLGFPPFSLELNSEGFRDSEDWTKNVKKWKKEGKKRIVILGDSVCFGFGIEFEKTAGELLEKMLGDDFVVLNMSVVGYSTDQEILLFEKEGKKFEPEFVIYCMWVNDIPGILDSMPLENGRGKPVFSLEGGKLKLMNVPVRSKSIFPEKYDKMFGLIYGRYTVRFFRERKKPSKVRVALESLIRRLTSPFIEFLYRDIIEEYISLLRAIFERGKECGGKRCKVFLLLIPDLFQAKGQNPYAVRMYDIIAREIDTVIVHRVEIPPDYFFTENFHPDERGHIKIAESMFKVISTQIQNMRSHSRVKNKIN